MAVLLTKGTGFGLLAGHVCEVLQKQDEQCSAAAKHDRTYSSPKAPRLRQGSAKYYFQQHINVTFKRKPATRRVQREPHFFP